MVKQQLIELTPHVISYFQTLCMCTGSCVCLAGSLVMAAQPFPRPGQCLPIWSSSWASASAHRVNVATDALYRMAAAGSLTSWMTITLYVLCWHNFSSHKGTQAEWPVKILGMLISILTLWSGFHSNQWLLVTTSLTSRTFVRITELTAEMKNCQ